MFFLHIIIQTILSWWDISVYYKHPSAGRHTTQELVRIHNDSASKSWSKYITDDKVGNVNYVKVTFKQILNQKNARPNNNHLPTYCQPVCYFIKNITIPCEYYLHSEFKPWWGRINLWLILSLEGKMIINKSLNSKQIVKVILSH